MPRRKRTTWDLLVSGDKLAAAAKTRGKESLEETIPIGDVDGYLAQGWTEKRRTARKAVMIKKKAPGDSFEDELWSVFFKMGFQVMNETNAFAVAYDEQRGLTKQIDILAIDDETCIFVECKESETERRNNFSLDISEIVGLKDKLFREILSRYPNRKCKYIFAVKNYILGGQDKNRLLSAGITFFDNNTVQYYKALANHLGGAARYQLLGSLFAGTEIQNMPSTVPAIRGKMGGLTYYTFAIEPEKLLKMGYVLHRTNANNDYDELLPSYQRLIKKDRLKSVREFVNGGGFFPNSIIISIDSENPLVFETGTPSAGNATAEAGILHLPQVYQSAYVIDGQHRLYGYSDSNCAGTDTIPVVAFEQLSKERQLKLFVEINENQKAVAKALRNILFIDIYDESPDPILRKTALLGRIAKRLGEDPRSPLYGRVIIGEDAATDKCCITLEFLKNALEKTQFFNKYKKNGEVLEVGLFDKGSNTETVEYFYPLLRRVFTTVQEKCTEEWNDAANGYLTKNNAIGAIIRIFNDIVGIVAKDSPGVLDSTDSLFSACEEFLLVLCETLNSLPADKRRIVRETRGTLANEKPYRVIQMAMHEASPAFTNESIEHYYQEKCIDYNDAAKARIVRIRQYLVDFTRSVFVEDDWLTVHAAEDHEQDLTMRVINKKIANRRNGISVEVDIWQELTILDIVRLIQNGTNWSDYYKDMFKQHLPDITKLDMITKLRSISENEARVTNGQHLPYSSYSEVNKLFTALIGE